MIASERMAGTRGIPASSVRTIKLSDLIERGMAAERQPGAEKASASAAPVAPAAEVRTLGLQPAMARDVDLSGLMIPPAGLRSDLARGLARGYDGTQVAEITDYAMAVSERVRPANGSARTAFSEEHNVPSVVTSDRVRVVSRTVAEVRTSENVDGLAVTVCQLAADLLSHAREHGKDYGALKRDALRSIEECLREMVKR
jgi:hypothetical protein